MLSGKNLYFSCLRCLHAGAASRIGIRPQSFRLAGQRPAERNPQRSPCPPVTLLLVPSSMRSLPSQVSARKRSGVRSVAVISQFLFRPISFWLWAVPCHITSNAFSLAGTWKKIGRKRSGEETFASSLEEQSCPSVLWLQTTWDSSRSAHRFDPFGLSCDTKEVAIAKFYIITSEGRVGTTSLVSCSFFCQCRSMNLMFRSCLLQVCWTAVPATCSRSVFLGWTWHWLLQTF